MTNWQGNANIKYSDNYWITFGNLWQYYRREPALNTDEGIIDYFLLITIALHLSLKIAVQTGNEGKKEVEIIVPLKYLSNFERTLEMLLINWHLINVILTWPENCFLINNAIDGQTATFTITDTRLYNPVVTLLTQDNVKILDQ